MEKMRSYPRRPKLTYNLGQNKWKTQTPPPLPPKSRMGKWRVFALRAPSSLIWGDGDLLFHFILSKIVAKLWSQISRRADVSFPVFARPAWHAGYADRETIWIWHARHAGHEIGMHSQHD